MGLVLLFLSWTAAYYLLPEGMLREVGLPGALAGESAAGSLGEEFSRILLLNLFAFTVIVAGNYILRVKYFSFGYLVPLAWMIMYAITLGTNSFTISLGEPLAPSLAVFMRSGPYEMMAATLLAVATDNISANYSDNFFSSSNPVPADRRAPMTRERWIAVATSLAILALAVFREAYLIMGLG